MVKRYRLVALSWCPSSFNSRFWCWSCNIGPKVRQVVPHCDSTHEWKCLGIVTLLILTLKWLHRLHQSSRSLALARYSFVVAMMNVIMCVYSVQQVSWYTNKLVNTSYVALGHEWQHRTRPHATYNVTDVNWLPLHQLLLIYSLIPSFFSLSERGRGTWYT